MDLVRQGSKLIGDLLGGGPGPDDLLWDAAEDPGLSEKSLSSLISARYAAAAQPGDLKLWGMYTFAGDVVVAMNPYAGKTDMADLYAEKIMDLFHAEAEKGGRSKPHIYGVAAKAHADIKNKNQAIVINGESGAGKTETTKLLINYLIHVAGAGKGASVGKSVADMLIASSPVLEAFGNAKTIRNDNSSRFGKYVRLLMGSDGTLSGATVEKYLLEKSRVTIHSEGERNYHAFYFFLMGASEARLVLHKACKLDKGTPYRFLVGEGETALPEVDAAVDNFVEVHEGLVKVLATSGAAAANAEEKADFYWKAIAGVLHLGEVKFAPKDVGCALADAASKAALANACELFGIDAAGMAKLEEALLYRAILLPGSSTPEMRPRDAKQASAQADGLAKEIYDRLFTMLVHETGLALGGDAVLAAAASAAENPRNSSACATSVPHIGLLDIFGFEIFDGAKNGFEQLLINYANDKLQLYFTDIAVAGLTKFYAAEIPWRLRKGTDLTEVDSAVKAALQLTEGVEGGDKYNIIDRLNDSALVDLATGNKAIVADRASGLMPQDKRLLEDLHVFFTGPKPKAGVEAHSRKAFVRKDGAKWDGTQEYRPRQQDVSETEWKTRKQLQTAKNQFGIQHFAALVPYNALGWTDTNFDRLDKELIEPCVASKEARLASLFTADFQPSATNDRSISERFRKEVSRGFLDENGNRVRSSLIHHLKECTGHFIRCIKPNGTKSPWTFDNNVAGIQLLSCGVLAAAMVNRTGYPDRPAYETFLKKYKTKEMLKPAEPKARGRKSISAASAPVAHESEQAKVQDVCKRPFPFGYGLKELKENFSVSTIDIKLDTDHTKPLWQRTKARHVENRTKPAKEDEPVPEHDFCVGIDRVFFSPGVLNKIATVTYPKILKALKMVVRLQCGARVMASVKKVKGIKFSEEIKARRRAEAEAKAKSEAEEAARRKAEFESTVAAQLSAESAKLLKQAQEQAEAALQAQYKNQIDALNETIERLKQDKVDLHHEAAADKQAMAEAHAAKVGEMEEEAEKAAEDAEKAAAKAAEEAAELLADTRASMTAAFQERERKIRMMHNEELAMWKAIADQRAAVERDMMEGLAVDIVECIAEWRRIRKNVNLLDKAGKQIDGLFGKKSNDGEAQLAEVFVKKGRELLEKGEKLVKSDGIGLAAPLYHKARFFLRAGATLIKKAAVHYEAISVRLNFKTVESYEQGEGECRQILADNKKLEQGGGISSMVSFAPGKKKEAGGSDLLDEALTGGDYGELAKFTKLLENFSKLKEEALAKLEKAAQGEEVEIA